MSLLVGLRRFLNVFSAGIAAGTFVLVLLALIPIVGRLTPSTSLAVHQALDPLVDRYNPAAVITAILTTIALLVLREDLTRIATILYVIGLAGAIGVAAMSLGFNMRINRVMAGWAPDAVPVEYGPLRERWNRCHRIRTACGLLAFACFVAATLASGAA